MLALEGITIVEIGRGATGIGTWFLGDLGADVITITPPLQVGGRDGGAIRPPTDEAEARRDAVYDAIGRNKRSMAIDLKSENGRYIFCQLADKADVIV